MILKSLFNRRISKYFTYLMICGLLLIQTACDTSSNQHKTALNGLINSSSPYLQQHADNPIDWYEWSDETLERAQKENKPIIISIGYSACHWCHVMEEESFMDSTVAQIMNEGFISIKVDREERPDVDKSYMEAATLLNGSAGWPLNVFALPDGRPFFAGTYFTTEQWKRLLKEIKKIYESDQENLSEQANSIAKGLKEENTLTGGDAKTDFSKTDYNNAFNAYKDKIDFEFGGIKGEQKFPMPSVWEALLQFHYLTKDKSSLRAVNTTLEKMANGGIYDQLGGGFSRYTTDQQWSTPHFEKMLYDNGQLVSLYSHAYQLTKNKKYAKIIRESLSFIKREMTSNDHGFYSSINADSQGEEGDFYVWNIQEIEEALGKEKAKLFIQYYGISTEGNWEKNKNILRTEGNISEMSKEHDISLTDLNETLNSSKNTLFNKRQKRVRPSLDNKILTSWNALMLKGYIHAYQALGEENYLKSALQNADFILDNMYREDGGLWRTYYNGKVSVEGFLDDYAFLIDAYIELYQVTFDKTWLDRAKKLAEYTLENFYDSDVELFHYSSKSDKSLFVKNYEVYDNEMPSSNSVMALNLYKLGLYFYEENFTEISKSLLASQRNKYPSVSPFDANWMRLMGYLVTEPIEVAIMGKEALNKSAQMQLQYLPTAIFSGGEKENIPLLEMKLMDGETMIYVCKNKTCQLPVSDVKLALRQFQ